MKNRISSAATAAGLLVAVAACAQAEPVLQGKDAYGDWQADKPGTVRLIRPQDLVRPGATPSVARSSRVVPRPPEAVPQVPAGFKIELFAEGLSGPRIVRVAPNGDIFVAETRAGRIRVLRAGGRRQGRDQRGVCQRTRAGRSASPSFRTATIRNGSMSPTPTASSAFPISAGDLKARGKAETIVASLPHGGGHSTRDIVFTPDDKRMLVSVGSLSNVAEGMGTPPGGLEAWSKAQPLGAAWGQRDRARRRAGLRS